MIPKPTPFGVGFFAAILFVRDGLCAVPTPSTPTVIARAQARGNLLVECCDTHRTEGKHRRGNRGHPGVRGLVRIRIGVFRPPDGTAERS